MEKELIIEVIKLSPKEQFTLRKQIVNLRKKGYSTKEVVEILNVRERHVQSTYKKYLVGGHEAIRLKTMGRPEGKNRKLTIEQEKEIQKLIVDKDPEQLKLNGCLWDRGNICQLIKHKYKIDLPKSTMSVYLKRWGFTPQRPIKQNYKQKPEQVKKWLDEEYPAIKERCKAEKGGVYWGDETGVQNETNYVKGYAPKGQTPTLKVDITKIKVNMISAISNQGKVRFMIYKDNMNCKTLINFMSRLIKSVDKKCFLILDNLKVHHGILVQKWLEKNKEKIVVFYLPPYSPEYNPDEYLNGNLKRDIAKKGNVHTVQEIETNTRSFMKRLQNDKDHVASYFKHKKIQYAAE